MKRIILLAGIMVCLTAASVVFGQTKSGVIAYETTQNLHRNIPPERESMKAMIPEYRTTKDQLFFNGPESIYKPVIEDEEEDITGSSGGGTFRMRMQRPSVETYSNSETFIKLSNQEFMGKKYLIEDTLKMTSWKFGTETREILGYTCRMAYYTHTEEVQSMRITSATSAPEPEKRTITQEITAWYTDQIAPFLGPDRFNNLPGTVLAVDINNGERVIVAKSVELRDLKKNELKVPSGGTKVTQEEYRKVVQEQMEKIRSNGGPMIIRGN